MPITNIQLRPIEPSLLSCQRHQMHFFDQIVSFTSHCAGIHSKPATERPWNSFQKLETAQAMPTRPIAQFAQTDSRPCLHSVFIENFDFPPVRMSKPDHEKRQHSVENQQIRAASEKKRLNFEPF